MLVAHKARQAALLPAPQSRGAATAEIEWLASKRCDDRELDAAVANLLQSSQLFTFVLRLSVYEGRLVFDVRDEADGPLTAIGLALGPFRGLIKDYQMLVDSHMKSVEEGRPERIQAIDMGRRGLHDEGAALLTERLAGKIRIDHDTARRLFTLVCVLHQRV